MTVRANVTMGVSASVVLVGTELYTILGQAHLTASGIRFETMQNGDAHICGLAAGGAAYAGGRITEVSWASGIFKLLQSVRIMR